MQGFGREAMCINFKQTALTTKGGPRGMFVILPLPELEWTGGEAGAWSGRGERKGWVLVEALRGDSTCCCNQSMHTETKKSSSVQVSQQKEMSLRLRWCWHTTVRVANMPIHPQADQACPSL
jgi:hypothetical protein